MALVGRCVLVALLAATTGCGEDRWVRVRVRADPVTGPDLFQISLQAWLSPEDGEPIEISATLPETSRSSPFTLPVDLRLGVEGAGTLVASVEGMDTTGAAIAGGSGTIDLGEGGSGEAGLLVINLSRLAWRCEGGGEICLYPLIAPTLGRPHGVEVADLDGDGRGDLLAGIAAGLDGGSGRGLSIARGLGEDRFAPPAPERAPEVSQGEPSWADLALGDVDGDGQVDALLGTNDVDPPALGLGNGVGGFETMATVEAALGGGASPHLVDVDGDGDLDLVVKGGPSASHVYIAPNGGDGRLEQAIDYDHERTISSVAVADVDARPGLEIIVGAWEQPEGEPDVAVLALEGDWVRRLGEIDVEGNQRAVSGVDLEGDGKAEIVVMTPDAVEILAWDGRLVFLTRHEREALRDMVGVPRGNGRSDLALLLDDEPGTVVLLRWGRSIEEIIGPMTFCDDGILSSADLDGDGHGELLLACSPDGVIVLRVGDPGVLVPQRLGTTDEYAVGDIDGDGAADVARDGTVVLDALADSRREVVLVPDSSQCSDPLLVNLDSEAGDEIAYLCPPGEVRWWSFSPFGFGAATIIALPDPERLAAARLVEDQPPRVVAALLDGRIAIQASDAASIVEGVEGLVAPRRMAAGGIDVVPGDDVVVRFEAPEGEWRPLVAFLSDGEGGLLPGRTLPNTDVPAGTALTVGDVLGDDRAEIVVGDPSTGLVRILSVEEGADIVEQNFTAGPDARVLDFGGAGTRAIGVAAGERIEVWATDGSGVERRATVAALAESVGSLSTWPTDGRFGPPVLLWGLASFGGDTTDLVVWGPPP